MIDKLDENEVKSVLLCAIWDIAENVESIMLGIDNLYDLDDFDIEDIEDELEFINEKMDRINQLISHFKNQSQSNNKSNLTTAIENLLKEIPNLEHGRFNTFINGKKYTIMYSESIFSLIDYE